MPEAFVASEVTRRWEQGISHDPRSIALFKSIRAIDMANNDYFDWRSGGDGDNGEELMFILDVHFAETDKPKDM